jgi:hypothetical protein
MSIYPSPKLRDGVLNTVFNSADYVRDTAGGGLTLAQTLAETDTLYLKNSGVVVSSANTTFNGTVNVASLLTVDNINVVSVLDTATANITGSCSAGSLKAATSLDTATITATGLCSAGSLKATTSLEANTITASLATIGTLKIKNSSDTLSAEFWRQDQVYSFTNGMVYSLISDATAVNSVSFINIPTTTNQSYIFTFILQPSVVNSPYYIKSNTNTININGVAIPLYGLQNVSLAGNYTYLVQQISIIYNLYATDPQFIALTSVSSY